MNLSPLALAFMGDAVHTAFVRKVVLSEKPDKIGNYHSNAKNYCNAKAQKDALLRIFDSLSDDEKEIVRKARNCHPKHSAKNYNEETYKKATAFEALIGYLFFENKQRLEEILNLSIQGDKNAN